MHPVPAQVGHGRVVGRAGLAACGALAAWVVVCAAAGASRCGAGAGQGLLFAADVGDLAEGKAEDVGELGVAAAAVGVVGGRFDEREACEAPCAFVAVGLGQFAGEDVAGVDGHEGDEAFGGVAVGPRFDVGGEPEALGRGECGRALLVGEGDGLHTVLSARHLDVRPLGGYAR